MRRAAVALAVLALAGCGGSSEKPEATTSTEDLVRYLPKDSVSVAVVDFTLARKELAQPKDATIVPPTFKVDPRSPAGQLLTAGSLGFHPLRVGITFLRSQLPALRAFDGGKLIAGASNIEQSGKLVNAVRTSQPFSEIADSLTEDGFEREGDTLTDPKGGALAHITDAGDGIVLITGEDVDPKALLDAPPGGPKDLEGDTGDERSERLVLYPQGGCITAIGGNERADGARGELRMTVEGTADAKTFKADALPDILILDAPRVDGGDVTAGYRMPTGAQADPILLRILQTGDFRRLYGCS